MIHPSSHQCQTCVKKDKNKISYIPALQVCCPPEARKSNFIQNCDISGTIASKALQPRQCTPERERGTEKGERERESKGCLGETDSCSFWANSKATAREKMFRGFQHQWVVSHGVLNGGLCLGGCSEGIFQMLVASGRYFIFCTSSVWRDFSVKILTGYIVWTENKTKPHANLGNCPLKWAWIFSQNRTKSRSGAQKLGDCALWPLDLRHWFSRKESLKPATARKLPRVWKSTSSPQSSFGGGWLLHCSQPL